jgi:hypothetical protein
MPARTNARAGMHPHHWADLAKAMMKLTDDFETNQYMFGWVVGANITTTRPEDMPTKFQDGFTDGRASVDASLGRYTRNDPKRRKTNGKKKEAIQDQGRRRDSV